MRAHGTHSSRHPGHRHARRPSPHAIWGPLVRSFVPRWNRESADLRKNLDEILTKWYMSCVDGVSLCGEPTGARSGVRPRPAGLASPWGPVECSPALVGEGDSARHRRSPSEEHAVPCCCCHHWVFKMGVEHTRYQRDFPVTPSPRVLFAGLSPFVGLTQEAVCTGRSSCPRPEHQPHSHQGTARCVTHPCP